MNPINVTNSECAILPKLKTKLVKKINAGAIEYFFELCCPQIITICNPCTDQVSLKIPRCFDVEGQYFKLADPTLVLYSYNNMNSIDEATDASGINSFGGSILPIGVNGVEVINKVCVSRLSIPVEPKCLRNGDFKEIFIGQVECTTATVT
jgi:hypothetical protein